MSDAQASTVEQLRRLELPDRAVQLTQLLRDSAQNLEQVCQS